MWDEVGCLRVVFAPDVRAAIPHALYYASRAASTAGIQQRFHYAETGDALYTATAARASDSYASGARSSAADASTEGPREGSIHGSGDGSESGVECGAAGGGRWPRTGPPDGPSHYGFRDESEGKSEDDAGFKSSSHSQHGSR
jgi:hypothetical protein